MGRKFELSLSKRKRKSTERVYLKMGGGWKDYLEVQNWGEVIRRMGERSTEVWTLLG